MKKKNFYVFLCLSLITLVLVFVGTRFNSIFGSTTDWISQHVVFPEYFRMHFYETKDLLPNFAFNIGSGQNIYNFSYYGFLSPYILLSYLLPFVKMIDYIIILNIIIVIVSAYLFYKWLIMNQFNEKISFITSILFLLAAPLIFHSHKHFMFINYMPFLIMALMGIDYYFKNNRKALFIVSIFLTIMTSYYYSVRGIISSFYLLDL
jgi:uncharacterized membrane protein YfhO